MSRWIGRFLTVGAPFVAIVALFASAVAWHVTAPVRQAALFHRLVEDDQPLAHDYGDASTITMVRQGCVDGCPAYVVRLHGSGEVEFVGRAFVCVMHPLTDRILRPTAQRLIDAMVRAGFGTLEPWRGRLVRDFPVTVTTLDLGTSRRAIQDGGDRPEPVVAEIEHQIDRTAGTARWKRIPRNDGAQQPFCAAPDGTKKVFDGQGRLVPEVAPATTAASR